MNRVALPLAALVVASAVAFFFWFQPKSREAGEVKVSVTEGDATPATSRPLVGRSENVAPETARPPRTADGGVILDSTVQGPSQVDLGEHTLYLREGTHVLHVGLRLEVPDGPTRDEAIRKRSQLIRMLFFLGSHRSTEGAEGEEGRDRFEQDLEERFRNVIRAGELKSVEFYRYEVALRPVVDGGVAP